MGLHIDGMGIGLPIHGISQDRACAIAQHGLTGKQSRLLATIYRKSTIQRRHTVLLDQTGLNVRLLGAVPVDRFQLACAGTRAMLHTPPGLAISREILDVALIGHAQRAGACFMPQTAAQQTQAFPLHRQRW